MDKDGAEKTSKAGRDRERPEIPGELGSRLLGNPHEDVQGAPENLVDLGLRLFAGVESLSEESSNEMLPGLEHL
eukprot:14333129-Alexandrium_andersonii.AAC.1